MEMAVNMDNLTIIFPILAAFSVIILIVIKVYFKIREWLPVSVNCWFCNSNSKVAYNQFNSWVCSKCDQYNGFTQDGGYNKVIPAQHDEYLNVPCSSTPRVKYTRQTPALCRNCNMNQQLKVAQLAAFVPLDWSNYDREVDIYGQQLGKVYDICGNCNKKIADLFEKEKSHYSQHIKNEASSELDLDSIKKPVKRIKNKLVYYGVILGCTPQVLGAIFQQDSVKELCSFIYGEYIADLFLPDFLEWLTVYKDELIWMYEIYDQNYSNFSFGLIGLCMSVYFVELIKSFSLISVLNLTAWCIIFALKYFSAHVDESVVLLQGLTAAVFLVLNKRNNVLSVRNVVNRKQKIVIDHSKNATVQSAENLMKREMPPSIVSRSPNSAFRTIHESRELPKRTSSTNQKEAFCLSSRVTESNPYQKDFEDDLGISGLHLGTYKQTVKKNHLMREPRPCYDRSKDTIWNRPPILSPSRLNVNHDRHYSSLNNFAEQSPTRCSSQTSGISSLSSTAQLQDTAINDRDFDCFSDAPNVANHSQVIGYYSPYDPMYHQQMAMSPYTYYQFAAMFQRMCTPPGSSSFSSECSGDRTLVSNVTQCKHDRFYVILISLIIVCNFVLIGLISYKEFFTAKA